MSSKGQGYATEGANRKSDIPVNIKLQIMKSRLDMTFGFEFRKNKLQCTITEVFKRIFFVREN